MNNYKYFAIGDIHGFWRELNLLLSGIEKKYDLSGSENKFIFLGDYIDRGESSYLVLEKLIQLKKQYPHFEFLMGNHEHMYLKSNFDKFEFNDMPDQPTTEHLQFLNELKTYHMTD
jgi:serine/threonine protein phosphatase 1